MHITHVHHETCNAEITSNINRSGGWITSPVETPVPIRENSSDVHFYYLVKTGSKLGMKRRQSSQEHSPGRDTLAVIEPRKTTAEERCVCEEIWHFLATDNICRRTSQRSSNFESIYQAVTFQATTVTSEGSKQGSKLSNE